MTYWHMQLHPDDKNWEREKELLEKKSLIGCGLSDDSQLNLFRSGLEIDDIVLIKRGNISIALVKVIGDFKDVGKNNLTNLAWFRYRRKIEILGWAKNRDKFPSVRKTMQRLIDKKSKSYKYIDSWYQEIFMGIQLRHIYIEDYKMFKNFNLSFTNENQLIPIIVVAGINGSGKTSLLKHIKNFVTSLDEENRSYIKFKDLKKNSIETLNSVYNKLDNKKIVKRFQENIMYVPLIQDINDVKRVLIEYQQNIMYKKDIKPSESYQIIIDNIYRFLGELDLKAKFDGLDEKEEVYFKNTGGTSFPIDDLSSGQKTILIKMLSLYLSDVRGKVILIDEPELSLHPSWQNKIIKLYESFAKKNSCQIIIATHSPHIIGSAKNEYLRILKFNDENSVDVISGVTNYGRDINWVLEDVMETDYTREKAILDKLNNCQQFINNGEYDKAESLLNKLESIIGENDSEIIKLRTDLAFERMELEED